MVEITEETIKVENDSSLVIITKHAYERSKERLNWKPSVLDKMAEKAFLEGFSHKDAKGLLKKYITKLWFSYKHSDNVKIYGENIFFFNKNKLITLYQLPHNLRKFIKYSKE